MSVLRISTRRLGRALALGALIAGCGGALALGAGSAPRLRTDRGCYRVGAPVHLSGSGFAPRRTYVVTVDDVYFGQASTNSAGRLRTPRALRPGGLPAGYAQSVERLEASDGSSAAHTSFTLTRRTGARFGTVRGSGAALRAPVQAWDFSPSGAGRSVYLHWVSPLNTVVRTARLGRARGQCGYLSTRPIRVFPFTPAKGRWVFQIDTHRSWKSRPRGPVTRIPVAVH